MFAGCGLLIVLTDARAGFIERLKRIVDVLLQQPLDFLALVRSRRSPTAPGAAASAQGVLPSWSSRGSHGTSRPDCGLQIRTPHREKRSIKSAMIGLAVIVMLASPTLASTRSHPHSHHHHHGWALGGAARNNPKGTAGGPTSVSGTGPSKFGGQIPGVSGAARQ